jgi:hypothetical protein
MYLDQIRSPIDLPLVSYPLDHPIGGDLMRSLDPTTRVEGYQWSHVSGEADEGDKEGKIERGNALSTVNVEDVVLLISVDESGTC